MDFITRFGLDRQRFSQFILAAIILFGLFLYSGFPSREEPQIVIRVASVVANFEGMSPSRMENLIVKPIEKKIKELEEVKDITVSIRTGKAIINVSVHDRYTDVAPIWQKLRNKMKDIAGSLPSGTQGPFVNDDYGRVAPITLALTGTDYSHAELREVARSLQDEFNALPLVARVTLHGIQEERIWLNFNEAKLLQNQLQSSQITNELKNQNVILPAGIIEADGDRFVIEPTGTYQSVEDIKNTLVKLPNSESMVYLRDLVDVERGYQDPPSSPVTFNGKTAVILGISQIPNTAIAEFAKQVDTQAEQQRLLLPAGLELKRVNYQPAVVDKQINEALSNLFQTVLVVLAVVMVFLGLRLGLLVGSLVPLTILLSLIGMNAWGVELQIVSIAAVIIALGLLVDNGIVMAEDIKRRIDNGETMYDAAIDAARSLSIPLLSSSLTTILAFMPLMLADNQAGEYISSLSQVIILTLLSSWLLSIYALPMLYAKFIGDKKAKKQSALDAMVSAIVSRMQSAYSVLLSQILHFRKLFLLAMVALFAMSIVLMGLIPKDFFPPSSSNQFVVYLDLPAGTDIRKTQQVTQTFSDWLADKEQNPELVSATAYIGDGGPRFIQSLSPPDPAPNAAFFVVTAKQAEGIDEIARRARDFALTQLPDARARIEKLGVGGGGGKGLALRLIGPNKEVLQEKANTLVDELRKIPNMKSIHNDWESPVAKIIVKVDQSRARRAGLDSSLIANALQAHFSGMDVSDYREGDKVIPIRMRADQDKRSSLDSLRQITIMSPTNQSFVPLLQVVEIDAVIEPSQIRRRNLERTIELSAKHQSWPAATLLENIQPMLDNFEMPAGHRLELAGDVADSDTANAALFEYMPACLMGIVILLVLQFNSARRPAVILATIPLCLIGASFGLFITGESFGFMCMLGLFSLAGIIINNGIVLIERIEEERAKQDSILDSIQAACEARMRPILVTTCTTALGLIPLILFGGSLWSGMGIVIAFGIVVGSLLTLGFVPALYALLFKAEYKH
ncbi:MAG: efflux RND transporter permease subunit [Cellvibrionaceae bacterium]|nr:efflux RND transporter permease subunit [Cellvibrionaceae bacterium]